MHVCNFDLQFTSDFSKDRHNRYLLKMDTSHLIKHRSHVPCYNRCENDSIIPYLENNDKRNEPNRLDNAIQFNLYITTTLSQRVYIFKHWK